MPGRVDQTDSLEEAALQTELPIDAHLGTLCAAIGSFGAAVLVAPPGAGKTTRVPPALLDAGLAGSGRVVVLQPRRIAARSTAARMAQERGSSLGSEVGYRIRFERRVSRSTRIEVLTEGLLLRQLQEDPFLEGVGCVVLDEFHERSLDADLALGLLAEVRRDARPDLKVLVMSATLDPGPVAAFLGGAPVLEVPGRTYPVEILYRPAGPRDREVHVAERAAKAVRAALAGPDHGHILVFFPGVGEIHRCARALEGLRGADVHLLHGSLPPAEQDRALAPTTETKVVLATNVAETSLTIDGVRTVIDTGQVRVNRLDTRLGMARLEREWVSKASADQRAGRAGRTAPGRAIRLWSEADQRTLAPHLTPEVARADLTRTVLELRAWGVSPDEFTWLEAPPAAQLLAAQERLEGLGAVAEGGLTALGRQLSALPLAPRLGAVLVAARGTPFLEEAAAAAALASERDILLREEAREHGPDMGIRLDLLAAAREHRYAQGALRRLRLHPGAARQAGQVWDALLRSARRLPRGKEDSPRQSLEHALIAGFPDRVGLLRAPGSGRYQLADGGGARLPPGASGQAPDLILALALRAGARGTTGEPVVELAMPINRSDLQLNRGTWTRYDEDRQAVVQSSVVRYRSLVLEEHPVGGAADPVAVALALAEAIARDPQGRLELQDGARHLLARLRSLAAWRPELNLPTLSSLSCPEMEPDSLILALCHGQRSLAGVARQATPARLRAELGYPISRLLDDEAPETLKLPSGRTARIRYREGEAPVLEARIQELFGLFETPRVAGGRIPLLIHALAPNRRPAQVTRDLASFWDETYPQVRKELRGRYPKHAWPEDPYDPAGWVRKRRKR